MTQHDDQEREGQQPDETVQDLEVSEEEGEDVRGGAKREGPAPDDRFST
jgi:hypothetical protein